MKKKIISTIVIIISLIIVHFWGAQLGGLSLIIDHMIPRLISSNSWKTSIEKDPTAHGYSAYGILEDRGSDIAIELGLRDINSDDPYVWLNAASYLGSQNQKESIPYLIKSLRHSAHRSVVERFIFLKNMTGEDYGTNFDLWINWYTNQPEYIELDWETSLGHSPKI